MGIVHQIKLLLLFLVSTSMLTSCFTSYDPEIRAGDINKLVVNGVLTDRGGDQTVTLTMPSSIHNPKTNPVPGCTVTISDTQGHQFPMTYSDKGNYHGLIDAKYFTTGNSFKVEIITPDEDKIDSDFDQFSTCPDIDSVYFIIKDMVSDDPEKPVKGIQFYIDLDGNNTDSRLYRFEAFETYEYHSAYPIEWYYSYGIKHVFPDDYSKQICWGTYLIRNIFILSTEKLAVNKYKLSPLNFVDNHTQRLVYGYSLLVNQYSLSKAAYKYWDQLRTNSTNEGGLYERQPLGTKGNLHNLTHPDREILGFFGVSSVKSKRIFVRKVENLELETQSTCGYHVIHTGELEDANPIQYPIYLLADSATKIPAYVLEEGCADCRDLSGTTVKPDYWPY
jgi:hypothetical protein